VSRAYLHTAQTVAIRTRKRMDQSDGFINQCKMLLPVSLCIAAAYTSKIYHSWRVVALPHRHYVCRIYLLVNQERAVRRGLDSANLVLLSACMACFITQASYMRTLVTDRKGFDLAALPAHIPNQYYRVCGTDGIGAWSGKEKKVPTYDGTINGIKYRHTIISLFRTQTVCICFLVHHKRARKTFDAGFQRRFFRIYWH
jgi:hypothetical protein